MKKRSTILQASVLSFLLGGGMIQGEVIFNNTGSFSVASQIHAFQWYAQSFVVDENNYNTATVELNMSNGLNPSGNFFVSIYDASGLDSRPGNSLATLSGPSNPATLGYYDYTGTVNLSANTTYWVVAGVSSGAGTYAWSIQNPAIIETGAQIGISQRNGPNWGAPSLGQAFLMSVDATVTAVPEPTQWGIMATLLCAGSAVLRKRYLRRSV